MIEIRDLTIGYGGRVLLDNVSCKLSNGQAAALVGRNGAGKSSLLRVLSGMDKPLSGEVLIGGRLLAGMKRSELSRSVSLVTTERVRIPNMFCRDVVALGRAPYTNWVGRLSDADHAAVEKSLELVGMQQYARRAMDTLSDGECQRIMIARALAQDTDTILLDEPTSFLDLPNRYELVSLLVAMAHSQNKCVLFSTHELGIALMLCDTVMLIDDCQLIAKPKEAMLRDDRLRQAFGSDDFDVAEYLAAFKSSAKQVL